MRTTLRSIAPPAASRGPEMLAVAAGIGERLVRDAVWYRDRCNWVGVDTEGAHGLARSRPAHRALGPDLAAGTAGIALFLAQLHAATGDAQVDRTARGAIGQALAHAAQSAGGGLYGGQIGIAYAAARCGVLLGDERLLRRAARLARGEPAATGFDVVSGTAGAIVGLIALARLLVDDRLVRRAGRLGDDLAGAARRGPDGWSWPVHGERLTHGLCGIAHGAGGAAWALLELFEAAGERRHRDAAVCALDYERSWSDAQEANWPDLRGVRRRERRGSFRAPYLISWSHGAPGVALTRLRAQRILGDDRCRAEAAVALATTAAAVQRMLTTPGADFTLGHGLAGNADVLLLGADPAHAALAQRAAEVGAGRYAASVDGWPCGAPGHAPALLAGHAGIGLLYLRLHDRGIPSPLLIGVPAP